MGGSAAVYMPWIRINGTGNPIRSNDPVRRWLLGRCGLLAPKGGGGPARACTLNPTFPAPSDAQFIQYRGKMSFVKQSNTAVAVTVPSIRFKITDMSFDEATVLNERVRLVHRSMLRGDELMSYGSRI